MEFESSRNPSINSHSKYTENDLEACALNEVTRRMHIEVVAK
jgi:hypothetical protein